MIILLFQNSLSLRLDLCYIRLHPFYLLFLQLSVLLYIFLYFLGNFLQLRLLLLIIFFLLFSFALFSLLNFGQIVIKELSSVRLVRPPLEVYLLGRPERAVTLADKLLERLRRKELIARNAAYHVLKISSLLLLNP